ncbi:MAG: Fe2+ or Zn2+ uptake regulation protein [Paraglaciecola sp.]|jgi:Fe2+ or Zn2+ uptake regulation protein
MKIPVDQTMVLVQKLCEENSIRLTTQRKMVLDVLLGAAQALSAYDLKKI